MNFKVIKITDNIFHLVFPNEELACRTMVRFAEHFESPKFRGKVFSWRRFKSWYKWQKGAFSYYQDWGGFNIPGHIFKAFRDGSFDPLTWGEKDVLAQLPVHRDDFYVIATAESDQETVRHELAHAFYYLDKDYKRAVSKIMRRLPDRISAREEIRLQGYHPSVLLDELHAYTLDGIDAIYDLLKVRENSGLWAAVKYWRASVRLNRLLDDTLVKHKANG